MKVRTQDVHLYEYVLTLTPLEAENLWFILNQAALKGDQVAGPLAETLRAGQRDQLKGHW